MNPRALLKPTWPFVRGLSAALLLCALGWRAFAFPFRDTGDGISCAYFDVQLGIPWRSDGPEWLDADGTAQGKRAFATLVIPAGETARVNRVIVTDLVRRWFDGRQPNVGFLLREPGNRVVAFHARESSQPELRPQLLIQTSVGRRRYIEPAADATIDCSTIKGVGDRPTLQFAHGNALALRFDLGPASVAETLTSAELILVRADSDRVTAPLAIGVFALRQPYSLDTTVHADGLARGYPGDRGIDKHPAVLFADAMEASAPAQGWRRGQQAPTTMVASDAANAFVPLRGKALRVTVPRNGQLGLDLRYRFRDHQASEPEEVYFRYYLRLAPDWLAAVDGGKLPGLAGTYGKAGWGGRTWDGNSGWSLRGGFSRGVPAGHPKARQVMLSTYAYHAGAKSNYGESLPWVDGDLAGLVATERWVCIEQHLRINSPGQEDGLLEVWVDGRLALHRADLRLRDRADIRIEEVWMNLFHGGTAAAPSDLHAYIDQVVVARQYIGPMAP